MPHVFLTLARDLIPLVIEAGEIELAHFENGVEAIDKQDGSPVTLADREAEKLISAGLQKIRPGIPMVGEESVAAGDIPDISSGTFFLVDPLDGTKEFITGGGDFTVNIALLRNFEPVMGVIYVPVSGALYFGAAGEGAYQQIRGESEKKMSVRPPPTEGITVVASKRHGDPAALEAFLSSYKVSALAQRSSSLKFCVVAAGEADLYPRLDPTSEWDTAAGDAIVRAAGGCVRTLDGAPLRYGKIEKRFLNPAFVVSTVSISDQE